MYMYIHRRIYLICTLYISISVLHSLKLSSTKFNFSRFVVSEVWPQNFILKHVFMHKGSLLTKLFTNFSRKLLGYTTYIVVCRLS